MSVSKLNPCVIDQDSAQPQGCSLFDPPLPMPIIEPDDSESSTTYNFRTNASDYDEWDNPCHQMIRLKIPTLEPYPTICDQEMFPIGYMWAERINATSNTGNFAAYNGAITQVTGNTLRTYESTNGRWSYKMRFPTRLSIRMYVSSKTSGESIVFQTPFTVVSGTSSIGLGDFPANTLFHNSNASTVIEFYDVDFIQFDNHGTSNQTGGISYVVIAGPTRMVKQSPFHTDRDHEVRINALEALNESCTTGIVEITPNVNASLGTMARGINRAEYTLPANSYNYVALQTGSDEWCEVTIKRADTNQNSLLRIESTSLFDGHTRYIELHTTAAFNTIIGESVTLKWFPDAGHWSIV